MQISENQHLPNNKSANLSGQNGFLTIEDLAKTLRLSRSMIYKLVEKGKIPFYRFGSAIRFCPQTHLPLILQTYETGIKKTRASRRRQMGE